MTEEQAKEAEEAMAALDRCMRRYGEAAWEAALIMETLAPPAPPAEEQGARSARTREVDAQACSDSDAPRAGSLRPPGCSGGAVEA